MYTRTKLNNIYRIQIYLVSNNVKFTVCGIQSKVIKHPKNRKAGPIMRRQINQFN